MKLRRNNLKKGTSLIMGGLLVIAFLFVTNVGILVYKNLSERDNFLNLVPKEIIFYWHSNTDERAETKNLFFAAICQLFKLNEFSLLKGINFENKEISLAVFPDKEAVLFFTVQPNEDLKTNLEETNLSYVLGKEQILLATSPDTLLKIINVRNNKIPSLGEDLITKSNLIHSTINYPSQIYFDSRIFQTFFSIKNFPDFLSLKNTILIIPNNKNFNENSSPWRKYNFILISKNFSKDNELENFIKEKLAQILPISQEKTLPDGTTVKELISDPSLFQFKNIDFLNFKIHYVIEPRLDFEFALTSNDNLFASNSLVLLEEYLKINRQNLFQKLWQSIRERTIKNKQFKYIGIKYVDKL